MTVIDTIQSWSGALATLLSIGAIIYTWLTARSRANGQTIERHETKLISHDRRIQTLEGEFKHMPSKDDIHGLMMSVETIKGELGKMGATYEGVNRSVRRIEDFLMKEGAKHER